MLFVACVKPCDARPHPCTAMCVTYGDGGGGVCVVVCVFVFVVMCSLWIATRRG
jgi:hypothetical protein